MKLAAKLIATIILALVLIRIADGYLTVRRETQMFSADMNRDAHLLGRVLKYAAEDAYEKSGLAGVNELVAWANANHPIRIRWLGLEELRSLTENELELPEDLLEELMSSQEVSHRAGEDIGLERLYTFVPLSVNDEVLGVIELSEAFETRASYVRRTIIREVVLACIVIVVGAVAVVTLGLIVVGRPLQRLSDQIRRIASGDLTARVQLRRRDELGRLADGLNDLSEQLSAARIKLEQETLARIAALTQLRHVDRLSTLGRFASGTAHELGTPLNVVSGRAAMIERGGLSPEDAAKCAQIIHRQALRMAEIVRNLLDFARQKPPQRERCNLREIVQEAIALVDSLGAKGEIVLQNDTRDGLFARVDAGQIQQVLTNLIENALQAMPDGGRVEVSLYQVEVALQEGSAKPGRYLCVSVRDEGVGIAEEHLQHIFDPFFTTKQVGQGTGLGLSIAWGIVSEHDGWIGVESEVGRGSRFSMYLPEESEPCPEEC